jgi:lipoate-protein ligase A
MIARKIHSGGCYYRTGMRLDSTIVDGVTANLALDEEILKSGEETLRFWECCEAVVVVGRSGRVEDQVRMEVCEADGVPVVRRASGGGAVVLGTGCLNYSLVLRLDERPEWRDVRLSLREILGRVAQALDVEVREPSDLALRDRKVSGCAQRRTATGLLHHGTLLYAFDAQLAERYLCEPGRQPPYREGRRHADFLGNLALGPTEIQERLRKVWLDRER